MDEIVRGTTPILEFTFSEVNIQDITVAYLEIEQFNKVTIEKPFSEATTSATSISWSLTQAESLLLTEKAEATITCVWKLSSGVRGESEPLVVSVRNTPKNKEI